MYIHIILYAWRDLARARRRPADRSRSTAKPQTKKLHGKYIEILAREIAQAEQHYIDSFKDARLMLHHKYRNTVYPIYVCMCVYIYIYIYISLSIPLSLSIYIYIC